MEWVTISAAAARVLLQLVSQKGDHELTQEQRDAAAELRKAAAGNLDDAAGEALGEKQD